MRSYDLARRPPPSPLSRHQVISLSQSSCVSPAELTDGEGGEGASGRRAKLLYDRKKAWSSGNNSVLSGGPQSAPEKSANAFFDGVAKLIVL